MDPAMKPLEMDTAHAPRWLVRALAEHEGEPDPGEGSRETTGSEHPFDLGFV